MSESQNDDSVAKKKADANSTYPALGVVFFAVGFVFFLTMDNWAIGLPFVALGLAFFSMGVARMKKPKAPEGPLGTDPDADGPPAGGAATRPGSAATRAKRPDKAGGEGGAPAIDGGTHAKDSTGHAGDGNDGGGGDGGGGGGGD
ncbi:hypothetical protein [Marisediminicola sp. LYQ85]|uniref:hypothetical protein n=1 Tax=Marisediminicola sp. LYQ85 TaxID=3391062 RepID=UPI003982EA17